MEAFYIILTAALVAVNCSLLGSFLILRKMAMVGDAISHAVLPGIVLAFMVSGSRAELPMLLGAALVGLLTVVLIEWLHQKARIQADASIGITFTWLFALGVILISAYAGDVDLDQDCVLYGEIAYVPLDLLYTAQGLSLGPRAAYISGGLLLLILTFIIAGYKGLILTTFNEDYARSLGIATVFWHLSFMGLVSLTTVLSFESVGAILIVALLVVPPATAYLLTQNLKTLLLVAALLGISAALGGYYLAQWLNGSIAGAMATVAGLQLALAFGYNLLHNHSRLKKTTNSLPSLMKDN